VRCHGLCTRTSSPSCSLALSLTPRRTEFRALEVQLTDFENAAYTVFIVLVTRVILAFDLVLYMPISRVDDNMQRAHARKAATTQLFHWRKSVDPGAQLMLNMGFFHSQMY
jgi:glutamate--cysteine ligase catalytic subunit